MKATLSEYGSTGHDKHLAGTATFDDGKKFRFVSHNAKVRTLFTFCPSAGPTWPWAETKKIARFEKRIKAIEEAIAIILPDALSYEAKRRRQENADEKARREAWAKVERVTSRAEEIVATLDDVANELLFHVERRNTESLRRVFGRVSVLVREIKGK